MNDDSSNLDHALDQVKFQEQETIPDGQIKLRYLPIHEGLPKPTSLETGFLDLFCAESDGVWINTTESRVVTIRCGLALLVGSDIAVHIHPVDDITSMGIIAVSDCIDSMTVRTGIRVTLINCSTRSKKIQRGQRIARMSFVRPIRVENLEID